MSEAGRRIQTYRDEKKTPIIRYPGDRDPSRMHMTNTRKENRQNPDCAATNAAIPAANTIIDMNLFKEQQPRQCRVLFITENLGMLPAQAKERPMSESAGAP